jgi:hypothetical protein
MLELVNTGIGATYFRDLPKGYGFGLPAVYLVWLGVVAALYPLCRRYAELKRRRREWLIANN